MAGTIHSRLQRWLSLAGMAFLFAIALFPLMTATSMVQAKALSDNSMAHAVRLASPAVVRIVSVVDSQLTCYGCANDGTDIVSQLRYAESGSGAFISPDGYILTANHVVDHSTNNQDDVDIILTQAINDIAAKDGLSQNAASQYLQQKLNASQVQVSIQAESEQVFLSTAYTGQMQSTSQIVSFPVSRIVANSAGGNQDTAIIKIETTNMPSLTLASASALNVGDTVTAIGYPGDADATLNGSGNFTVLLNPGSGDINTINSLLDSSVNSGQITAQKTMQDGTPEYETTGIAAPGSSGAPVIDQQGQIIGFVDAGTSNDRLTFLIPGSVAADYVRQAGANTTPGPLMQQWTNAVNAYDATTPCHMAQAYKDLQALHNNYTQFGGVVPLLQIAQTQAQCTIPTPPAPQVLPEVLGIAGGIVLLAAILAVVFFIIIRRSKRTASQAQLQKQGQGQFNAGSLTPPSLPPVRQCPYGHIVSDPAAYLCPACGIPLSVGTPPPPPAPYATHTGNTNYGGAAPLNSNIATDLLIPVRRCSAGHNVQEPGARFCPQCGMPVREISAPQQPYTHSEV